MRVYVIITAILGLWLHSNIVYANNCEHLDSGDASVPLCPANGQVLSEVYPAKAVMISDHNVGVDYVSNFVREVVSGNDRFPVVVASVSEANCVTLRDRMRRMQSSGSAGIPENFDPNTHIICNTNSSYLWQQDVGQAVFDPSSGEPTFKLNSEYPEFEENKQPGMPSDLRSALQAACGIKTSDVPVSSNDHGGGGNIEAAPPNLCLIGSKSVNQRDVARVRAEFCSNGADYISVPTDFLEVGHTDEILKTVRTSGAPPCNFRVLVSDPSLGRELLANHSGPIIDTSDSGSMQLLQYYKTREVCRAGEPSPTPPKSAPSRPDETRRLQSSPSFYSWILFGPSLAYAGSANFLRLYPSDIDMTSPPSVQAGVILERYEQLLRSIETLRPRLDDGRYERLLKYTRDRRDFLLEMTQEDDFASRWSDFDREWQTDDYNVMVDALNGGLQLDSGEISACINGGFLAGMDNAHRNLNTGADRQLDQFALDLNSRLKNDPQLSQCGVESFIERVPDLFRGNELSNSDDNVLAQAAAQSVFPSPTNAVQVGNKLLFSDPMNEPYRAHLQALASRLGVEAKFLNTTKAHEKKGNLHCSTNVIRYCRPRGGQ